jgi:hypothetical protein
MLRTASSLPLYRAFDAGLRPGPFPNRAASLLPGLLAATRTGLSPAGDDELTNTKIHHGTTSRCHLPFCWAHERLRLDSTIDSHGKTYTTGQSTEDTLEAEGNDPLAFDDPEPPGGEPWPAGTAVTATGDWRTSTVELAQGRRSANAARRCLWTVVRLRIPARDLASFAPP